MWEPIGDIGQAADFWSPRPSGFWRVVLKPLRKFYLKAFYGIGDVSIEGLENLSVISAEDGVLLTPNHSHDSDPHVMMDVAARLDRQFYFMAAWQIFKGHKGIDGFVLQRMGAFSVDREGCDRRAIRKAIELVATGKWVVIFPEGEIYHTNDRLTPLREGVAFMACSAARDVAKEAGTHKVWIVPTAIRYRYLEDVTPALEEAMDGLEDRIKLRNGKDKTLAERILRFGEAMLTIKEKEQFNQCFEAMGDLSSRLKNLVQCLLERLENKWLGKTMAQCSVSERVKGLRQKLLESWADEAANDEHRKTVRAAIDDVQLVIQLYSYPGDYVAENPTLERMAETIEKFEEDVDGEMARPKGKRAARVILGRPIDVAAASKDLRPRAATTQLTQRLETEIKELMMRPPK